MFGGLRVKSSKATPKKLPSSSSFGFLRIFMDKCYRDPYRWDLIKCVAFFAASVYAARALTEMDILPSDPASMTEQAAY